ncbi:hypothetical protein [Mycobacterium tuberculosis]|uniref:hypothetical protein n=1 Tax=Mycobacterium tuberculosis TaxID=1773 RepID=UPI0005DFFEDF|nr:hypothetical protein [Mycobacterium tuberculosis]CLW20717.1 Uncharacterised protein [Mycobacterium tuberculosis]
MGSFLVSRRRDTVTVGWHTSRGVGGRRRAALLIQPVMPAIKAAMNVESAGQVCRNRSMIAIAG